MRTGPPVVEGGKRKAARSYLDHGPRSWRGRGSSRRRGGPVLTLATANGAPVGGKAPLRRRLPGAFWLAVVLLGAVVVALTVAPILRTTARGRLVVASLPYWNIDHGTSAVLSNKQTFSEVSPWMYGLNSGGEIVTQYGPGQAAAVNAQLARLRAANIPLVPSLANIIQGNWADQPVDRILHNQALMTQHVAAIVALVRQQHYAGIDIDYENLHAADRATFTAFVTQLAAALHANGKVLSVALFAKTTAAGTDPRNVAQDYAAIGRAADQVRLMAYDYHWGSSPPGPIAPVGWIRSVLRYAKTQIPAGKIILGIPLYGYDWSGGTGTPVSWLQAFRLASQYGAKPHFDAVSQAPWFGYTDSSGHRHVVWFENTPSSKAKFDVALGAGIEGVYLWMYGYEDTGTWTALRQTLPVASPPASSAPSSTTSRTSG